MNPLRIFHREPDFYIGGTENPYLLRWWIIPRNRFFNIYLHKFLRDDDDRALHDHPWVSCSIVLSGGYTEYLKGGKKKWRVPFNIIFRRAVTAHRIRLFREIDSFTGKMRPTTAWTLFITGPKIREWGFHCPKGWTHWKIFCDETDHGNIGRGCQ